MIVTHDGQGDLDDRGSTRNQTKEARSRVRREEWRHQDGVPTLRNCKIERSERPDLLMVLLPGIDRISHFLWGVLEPEELYPESLRPSRRERKGGARALFSCSEYTDALIGQILETSRPSASICCCFSESKTFAITHEATASCAVNVPDGS
jgi:hypothetical protein